MRLAEVGNGQGKVGYASFTLSALVLCNCHCHQKQIKGIWVPKQVLMESLGIYTFLHKRRNGNENSDTTSESGTLHVARGSLALSLLHTCVLGFRTRQCTERSFLSNLKSPTSLKQTAISTAKALEPDESHFPQVLKMLWPLSRLIGVLQGMCTVGCMWLGEY